MKEGVQGTRRAGEAKEKEKRTKDQAPKNGFIKEDQKKITLSRNRSPVASNTLIDCPNKASSSRHQPKRQRCRCLANHA
jgi:hypothetical protein